MNVLTRLAHLYALRRSDRIIRRYHASLPAHQQRTRTGITWPPRTSPSRT